ncbi:2871_t:CDS:1 [Dentiscutata erythropus]|uniref:2871_t:CDS:1 n=1 Tax=Dentiscutata erythropus TaxID=1348616 RepID=A0A9N9IIV0_9GLOM|nr:2871_t:CDS:1 [Dentiscutata erythropus]
MNQQNHANQAVEVQQNAAVHVNPNFTQDEQTDHIINGADPFPTEQIARNEEVCSFSSSILSGDSFNYQN